MTGRHSQMSHDPFCRSPSLTMAKRADHSPHPTGLPRAKDVLGLQVRAAVGVANNRAQERGVDDS